MSSVNFDPDMKVKMSLDDIIRLTKPALMNLKKKPLKNKKKLKKRNISSDHSVPLVSLGGGCIYVSKNSPLLRAQRKRMIQSAALNRMLNSKLLDETKKIIPANYKLFKTSQGVERILVPAEDCIAKLQAYNSPVWKNLQNLCFRRQDQGTQTNQPHLMDANIAPPINYFKMEVDDPDDIIVLNTKSRQCEEIPIINLELDNYKRSFEVMKKKLNLTESKVPETLNDRFTKLCSQC